MRVTVKAGADENGKLTRCSSTCSPTPAPMAITPAGAVSCCGESIGVYNCPNKKVDAVVAYTNTVPAGAFRGYGLPRRCSRGSRDRRTGQAPRAEPLRDAPPHIIKRAIHAVAPGPRMPTCYTVLTARPVPRPGPARDAGRDAEQRTFGGLADRRRHRVTMIDTVPRTGISPTPRFRCARMAFRVDRRTASSATALHGAPPDRRKRAPDHGRPDPLATIRHRHGVTTPALRLDRHLRRRTRDAGGGGKSRRRTPDVRRRRDREQSRLLYPRRGFRCLRKQRLSFADLAEAASAQDAP